MVDPASLVTGCLPSEAVFHRLGEEDNAQEKHTAAQESRPPVDFQYDALLTPQVLAALEVESPS